MTHAQLLRHFGTQAQVARALGLDRRTVNQWFVRGEIPARRQYEIEELTGGTLKAKRRRIPK